MVPTTVSIDEVRRVADEVEVAEFGGYAGGIRRRRRY